MYIEKDTKIKNKFYNAKIYKLIDNTNDNVYIGSCCSSLRTRLSTHKSGYEMFLFKNIKSYEILKNKNYIKSYEIIKNGDYKIELLEDCDINTKHELLERERYYIENNNCLNKYIPGNLDDKGIQQYQKEYYETNKEKFTDYNKDYYFNNKEKINNIQKEYREANKDKANEKFDCECGCKYTRCNKSHHIKTTKHLNYLKSQNK